MTKAVKQFTFRIESNLSDIIDFVSNVERRSKNDQLNKVIEEWLKKIYFPSNPDIKEQLDKQGLFIHSVQTED